MNNGWVHDSSYAESTAQEIVVRTRCNTDASSYMGAASLSWRCFDWSLWETHTSSPLVLSGDWKKALMGNVWNHKVQLQVDEAGWGENGQSTNCITTPHHETPPGACWWWILCITAWECRAWLFPLRVSVLECFLTQLHALFSVQYCILEALWLCRAASHSSWWSSVWFLNKGCLAGLIVLVFFYRCGHLMYIMSLYFEEYQ